MTRDSRASARWRRVSPSVWSRRRTASAFASSTIDAALGFGLAHEAGRLVARLLDRGVGGALGEHERPLELLRRLLLGGPGRRRGRGGRPAGEAVLHLGLQVGLELVQSSLGGTSPVAGLGRLHLEPADLVGDVVEEVVHLAAVVATATRLFELGSVDLALERRFHAASLIPAWRGLGYPRGRPGRDLTYRARSTAPGAAGARPPWSGADEAAQDEQHEDDHDRRDVDGTADRRDESPERAAGPDRSADAGTGRCRPRARRAGSGTS